MFDIYDGTPIGIDLGTTNSCIGYWNGKEVEIIPNIIGDKTTPSILYFLNNSNEYLVGEQSQKHLIMDCQKIYSIKRIIGRDFNDKNLEKEIKFLNFNIIKDYKTEEPLIPIIQNGQTKNYSPEYLSSLILKKLVNDAENLLTRPIKKVVIAVPAYFDDAQRSATIEAGKLAGLEVIRIINEPTAAALSYGLGQSFCPFKKESQTFSKIFRKNRMERMSYNSYFLIDENKKISLKELKTNKLGNYTEQGKNILVFDLGGGTFDMAVLQLNLEEKEYEVKSKISDKYLGGEDFDNKLVDYCLSKNGLKRNNNIKSNSLERLRIACERAKIILSSRENAEIRVENFIPERDIIVKITRKEFEDSICKDLFERLKMPFNELLEGAKLTPKDLDEIILVGGSTRMPKIKEILNELHFKCHINEDINQEEVVAYGATIQAAMLMTIGKNNILNGVKLFDITPISLGTDVINKSKDPKIKALGNKMSVIIPKWTKIPTQKEKGYKTIKDYQESMQICIFEGENTYLKDNKLLDKFTLLNITKKPKGQVQCIVTFEIDANNILKVTAVERGKGVTNTIEVKSSNKQIVKSHFIGNLRISQIYEEKNTIYYNLQKSVESYINTEDNNKKIKILENYNKILLKEIQPINPSEKEEGLNENNVEKYYFFIYQLFESYEEMMHLNLAEDKTNKILKDIKKYINIFKKQNNYYIKQFIDIFKDTDENFFADIFLEVIKGLNEMGNYYLENRQKFSRYYARLYFGEGINLYNKYKILENDEVLINQDIMNNIKDIVNKSKLKLIEINTNAISLINQSNINKALINISNPLPKNTIYYNNSISKKNNNNDWDVDSFESGFTFLKKKVNPNIYLKYDEYNIILDELEKILVELNLLIEKEKGNRDNKKELQEKRGICLGNIVKIQFHYLKGKKFSEYTKYIEQCLFDAKACEKNNPEIEWYQDAIRLQNEINEQCKRASQEISSEIEDELNKINMLFNQDNKINFINYILEKWPYNEYDKNNRPSNLDWELVNTNLIIFLCKKYHPDLYPKETQEEQNRYIIIDAISKKLNSLLEGKTPKYSGLFFLQSSGINNNFK